MSSDTAQTAAPDAQLQVQAADRAQAVVHEQPVAGQEKTAEPISTSAPTVSSITPAARKPEAPVLEGDIPFYKTVKRSFKDVTTEGGINTSEFCEADDAVIAFFDLFTNAPFAIVRQDLFSKITKVRAYLAENPETATTLEGILETDKKRGGKKEVTNALTWLLRSLRFTCLGMRMNLANPSEEVSTSMTRAYGQTLKPFHGIVVRPIFALAMKAVPYRSKFYSVLGEPQEEVMPELDDWLSGLERILAKMEVVYKAGDYGQI